MEVVSFSSRLLLFKHTLSLFGNENIQGAADINAKRWVWMGNSQNGGCANRFYLVISLPKDVLRYSNCKFRCSVCPIAYSLKEMGFLCVLT